LVSPSAVHATREWMTGFMDRVDEEDDCSSSSSSSLRVDYIGVHWYDSPNAVRFQEYLRSVYDLYGGRPLLLTEVAIADWTTGGDPDRNRWSEQQVLDFAKEVLPWLEQQDFIAGYAWFPFNQSSPPGHTSALFDLNGQLTALGRYYASVTPDNIYGDQSITVDY